MLKFKGSNQDFKTWLDSLRRMYPSTMRLNTVYEYVRSVRWPGETRRRG